MSEVYLDPAASLAVKLGGLENLASAAGVSLSRASRYRQSKDKGGTGGLIPSNRQQRILDWAARNGIDIGPQDFFSAAKVRRRERPRQVA
jgi:hypothetical protein